MRILLLHQYFLEKDDPGGSRFNEMTKIWTSKGHQVTVLAGTINYVTGKVASKYRQRWFHRSNYEERLEVIRCYVYEKYNASYLGRLWAYLSFVVSSIWAGLFKAKGNYDLILVTSPPLFIGISAYIISRIKRVPFAFEIRDLWPESAIDTGVISNKLIIRLAYALEKFIYRKSKMITVLTPAFREVLVSKKRVPTDKIILIPNGSDFTLSDHLLHNFDARAFRSSLGLSNRFVAIYVGAHGVANHLIQVLNAALIVKPYPISILLVGDGMQKNDLKVFAAEHQLDNVLFIDPVPKKEVFKYILASDVGLSVLKNTETFKTIYSNKTFDYMACQKPVIAAIDGITRELIEMAACGSFVQPENQHDLAEKLVYYAENHAISHQQGINGYKYAKAHFDRTSLAEQYLEELKNGFVND